jgi:hypothetical protein
MAKTKMVPPGKSLSSFVPGDIVLTHGDKPVMKAIRFGERIKYHGSDQRYAYWNHTFIVTTAEGGIIEAKHGNVNRNMIKEYEPKWYAVINPKLSDDRRADMIKFAESCLGQDYGFLTILGIGAWIATGGHLTFGLAGTEICSQLVGRSLEHAGMVLPKDPQVTMPADIAKMFDVKIELRK